MGIFLAGSLHIIFGWIGLYFALYCCVCDWWVLD